MSAILPYSATEVNKHELAKAHLLRETLKATAHAGSQGARGSRAVSLLAIPFEHPSLLVACMSSGNRMQAL